MFGALVSALRHHVRQHRCTTAGDGGFHLPPHHAEQGACRPLGGLTLVDVGIGLIAGDDLRVADHGGEDVGVHVVGDAERRVRIDGADTGQQLALTVIERFGDHGAVQVEPDGVEAALGDGAGDQAAERLKGLMVHRAAGRGAGADRNDDFGADFIGNGQVAAHAGTGAAVEVSCGLAGQQGGAVAAESVQFGRDRREGVRLVRHGCQEYAHRSPAFVESAD